MEKLRKFHVIAASCPLKRKTYCDKCRFNNGWDNNMNTYCNHDNKDWR